MEVLHSRQPLCLEEVAKILFSFFLVNHPDGFVLSEEGGRVCGYVIVILKRGGESIVSLAVSPGFRRRGHGGLLLKSALQEFWKKADRVELQVRAGDRVGVDFYVRRGFRVYSAIRGVLTGR